MKKDTVKKIMALALAGVCAFNAESVTNFNGNVTTVEAAAKTKNPSAPKDLVISEDTSYIAWDANSSKYDYIEVQFVIGDCYNGSFHDCVTYSTGWISSSNSSKRYKKYLTNHYGTGGRTIRCARVRSANRINGKYYKSKWNRTATWKWTETNMDGSGRVFRSETSTASSSFFDNGTVKKA